MTKILRKAIMLTSKFRNRLLKQKTEESNSLYQGVRLTLPPRIVSVQVKSRSMLHHGPAVVRLKKK